MAYNTFNDEAITWLMDKIKMNTSAIAEIQNRKVDGGVLYGSCSTAPTDDIKIVTLQGVSSSWTPTVGTAICVRFTNSNTATGVIDLKINDLDEAPVSYLGGLTVDSSNSFVGGIVGTETLYVYDGEYWVWMGQSYASSGGGSSYDTGTATTAGITKLYTTTGSNTDGTMTQAAITSLLGDVETLLAGI